MEYKIPYELTKSKPNRCSRGYHFQDPINPQDRRLNSAPHRIMRIVINGHKDAFNNGNMLMVLGFIAGMQQCVPDLTLTMLSDRPVEDRRATFHRHKRSIWVAAGVKLGVLNSRFQDFPSPGRLRSKPLVWGLRLDMQFVILCQSRDG